MISEQQLSGIRGTTVFDTDGDKIGKAGEVYLDDATGRPEWLTVNTGLFGTHESFVPLEQATLQGDEVRVPFDKAKIKDAPRVATDGHLDPSEEEELYRYYGLTSGGGSGSGFDDDRSSGTSGVATAGGVGAAGLAGRSAGDRDGDGVRDRDERGGQGVAGKVKDTLSGDRDHDGVKDRDESSMGRESSMGTTGTGRHNAGIEDTNDHGTRGRDTSGPTTDDAMTLSEEQLRVGTEQRQSGRARLRKYVVTEQQSVDVPVSHEEVRLEREPITDANVGAATDGPAISEEEHEITLHEEVPVVSKEARPVERVRATTETVTGQERVSDEVRKERVDMDGDGITDGTTGRGTTGRDRI
jgi:uncharacterized protein (TIGR02271 family)